MTDCRSGEENVQGELKHLIIPNSEEASRDYKFISKGLRSKFEKASIGLIWDHWGYNK